MSALKNFAGRFFAKFSRDETMTLAASLAFYTAFSLAPILILFVTCASFLSPELQGQFVEQVRDLVGPEAALTIEAVIDGAKDRQDLTSIAGLTGLLTLMISASLIFGELRNALNKIFEVSPPSDEKISVIVMILRYLKGRLVQIVLAFGFIMTIIISLGISSAISATLQSERAVAAALINILASFITYVLLFTLMFRFISARRQPLKCAAQGGALTALLFVFGKEMIGLYLGSSAVGSAYGAAGSLIALLVWVYYSTLITFVGAQVSSILLRFRPSRTA